MLFKPSTLPLDLTGLAETNVVTGEIKYIRNLAETVFCLSKGPFHRKDLHVVNNRNGTPLVIHQDYEPIQLYVAASKETGRPVYAGIRIINVEIDEVRIDYRPVGGKFQNFLGVILEMKDQFDADFVQKIPWITIQNLPEAFKPAPHTHSFWDMVNLVNVLNSIYQIYVGICIKQQAKYIDVYETLTNTLTAKFLDIGIKIRALGDRLEWYRNATQYDIGDILPTLNTNNPSNYLRYGTWALLPDVLLFGAAQGDTIGTLIGLQGSEPGDWSAKKVLFWQRQDDKLTGRYVVTASATNINEGESVTFTISAPGRVVGTAVDWVITGITTRDIISNTLTGTAFIGVGGTASVTVATVNDTLTEGAETIRFGIVGYPTIYAEVTLNDTSTNESFICYFSEDAEGVSLVTDANEGDKVYLIIKGTNVPPVLNYPLLYNGSTVDDADFIINRPTTVRILDGFAAIEYNIKLDRKAEDTEYLVIFLSATSSINQAFVNARLRIKDTSKTPTFQSRITSDLAGDLSINSADEGTSFYFHLYTTDLDNGTEITIGYSGTYNSADFTSILPQKITITNNYARIKFDVRTDSLSESSEYIEIFAFANGVRVANELVTINDTSLNAGYRAYFSSNRFGTNELSWVNEGDRIYLIVLAGGVPDGTSLPLRYRGSAIAPDFNNALPTNILITSETGVLQFDVTEDYSTEGTEQFIVSVMNQAGDTELASTNINIYDTSVEPTYQLKFSLDQFGNQEVTSIDEGQRVYISLSATGIPAVTTLGLDLFIGGKRATVSNGDVSEAPPSAVVIAGGRGSFSILTRADSTTEGDEILEVRVRASQSLTAPTIIVGQITVRDTSKDPTWEIELTRDEAGDVPLVGDLLEGESVWLQWYSANIPNGTVFWIDYGDGQIDNVTPEDFIDPLATYVTIQNNRAKIRYRVKQDYLPDQITGIPERFIINLYDNVSMTNKILSTSATILDPTFQMKFAGNSVGNGSITQANEGDIVYLVIDTVNVPDNAELKLEYYINGTLTTVAGVDLVEDPLPSTTIVSNKRIIAIAIKADGIPDGQKTLEIRLHGMGVPDGTIPLAVSTLTLIDTSTGGVTAIGTYRPNQIGTVSIAAGSTRTLTLVGGGGSGSPGSSLDPVLPSFDGTDGQATTLRFGATTMAIAGPGAGGLRTRGSATPGGATTVNQNFIDAATQFTVSNLFTAQGVSGSMSTNNGGASAANNNTGAGQNGNLVGTGGGSGAVVKMSITNNTTALLSFGITIGRGGILIGGGTATDWNNGSLIVE